MDDGLLIRRVGGSDQSFIRKEQTMSTAQEYAQLAHRVYARTPANRTAVPTGWTELQ